MLIFTQSQTLNQVLVTILTVLVKKYVAILLHYSKEVQKFKCHEF